MPKHIKHLSVCYFLSAEEITDYLYPRLRNTRTET